MKSFLKTGWGILPYGARILAKMKQTSFRVILKVVFNQRLLFLKKKWVNTSKNLKQYLLLFINEYCTIFAQKQPAFNPFVKCMALLALYIPNLPCFKYALFRMQFIFLLNLQSRILSIFKFKSIFINLLHIHVTSLLL